MSPHTTMTTGALEAGPAGLICSLIAFLTAGVVTTTNLHGWRLQADGAAIPAFKSVSISWSVSVFVCKKLYISVRKKSFTLVHKTP